MVIQEGKNSNFLVNVTAKLMGKGKERGRRGEGGKKEKRGGGDNAFNTLFSTLFSPPPAYFGGRRLDKGGEKKKFL